MLKKRVILSVILVGMLLILCNSAVAPDTSTGDEDQDRCCIGIMSGCRPAFDQGECGQDDFGFCSDNRCSVGCCIERGGLVQNPKYKLQCTGTFSGEAKPFQLTLTQDLCGELQACTTDNQCPLGNRCLQNVCIPGERAVTEDLCANNEQDIGEIAIDCGGTCPPCKEGMRCEQDLNCEANLRCDAETHKCKAFTTNCRNGALNEGEDCDFDISNNILMRQGIFGCADIENAAGEKYTEGVLNCNVFCKFETSQCIYTSPSERTSNPEGACGDGNLDTPNSNHINEVCEVGFEDRCGEGTHCDESSCQCINDCQAEPAELNMIILSGEGTAAKARVSWRIPEQRNEECRAIKQYVRSCEGEECSKNPSEWNTRTREISTQTNSYEDAVGEKRNKCYAVELLFKNNPVPQINDLNNIQCLEECTEGQRFCDAEDPNKQGTKICSNKRLIPDSSCSGESYCTEPSFGSASCVDPADCPKCNGLFEVFGGILFDAFGFSQSAKCEEAEQCIYDLSDKNVFMFRSCQDIPSCYSYKTKYACENDETHCKVSGKGCEWQEAIPELGIGICRSPASYAGRQDCGKCSEISFIGGCNADSCQKIGNSCYFNTFHNKNTCETSENLGCGNYNTESDCVGEGNTGITGGVIVDAQYTPAGVRYGRTNRVTQKSEDKFGYGLCRWGSQGLTSDICYKDADFNGKNDCTTSLNQEECEKDKTTPQTSLVLNNMKYDSNGKLMVGKYLDVPVKVSEGAETYFCINVNDNCYPKNLTMCRIQRVLTAGDSNVAWLKYYSEDFSHNLEELNKEAVNVDITPPSRLVSAGSSIRNRFSSSSILSLNSEATSQLDINLKYAEDVICNANLVNLKGEEILSDSTGEARTSSNRIINEEGREFTRSYYNLHDDFYIFKYECKDKFGNVDKGFDKLIRDTNDIHIPNQYTISNKRREIIRVNTQRPAKCFIKNLNSNRAFVPFGTADAGEMSVISGSDKKTHTFNAELLDDLNIFQVACLFDGETELTTNRADRIVISKDVYAPEIKFYSMIDKSIELSSGTYGLPQNLFVYCSDNRIEKLYGLSGLDQGCAEVSFKINGQSDGYRFGDLEREGFVSPFLPFLITETENAVVEVTAVDRLFVNSKSYNLNVKIRANPERELPSATAKLFDEVGNEVKIPQGMNWPSISKGIYYIKIQASGIIKLPESDAASFTITKMPNELKYSGVISANACSLENPSTLKCRLDLRNIDLGEEIANEEQPEEGQQEEAQNGEQGAEGEFPYNLYLNFNPIAVIEKGTECFPGENAVTQLSMPVNEFIILFYPVGPEIELEPIFSPIFFSGTTDWGAIFVSNYYYPIQYYPEEGLAYTNQRELFITGKIKNPALTEKIVFYSGKCGEEITEQKSFGVNQNINPIETEIFPINPENLKEIKISSPPGGIIGKYLGFKEPVDPAQLLDGADYSRWIYGKYNHYYKIESVDETRTPNTIILEDELEINHIPQPAEGQNVIPVQIWPNPAKDKWFGEKLNLEEGCNKFYAKGITNQNEQGTGLQTESPPVPTNLAGIIVDTKGPLVIDSFPNEGTTNEAFNKVGIVVEEQNDESDAPLLLGSIRVIIKKIAEDGTEESVEEIPYPANEGEDALADSPIKAEKEERDDKVYHTITYEQPVNFEGGYCFEFKGTDKATNPISGTGTAKQSFCFNVGDGTPVQPVWEFMAPIAEKDEVYYTNQNPNTNTQVKLDYSENSDEVIIGPILPDGKIQGDFYVKEYAESLEQKNPIVADCEMLEKNVFECTMQVLPQNKAYNLIVNSKLKLADGTESPGAWHVSPVLVVDNAPPVLRQLIVPPAVAYDGKLRISAVIEDSGFGLKGSARFEVQGREDLARTIELDPIGHQAGTNNYIFEWDVSQAGFNVRDKGILENGNNFVLAFEDYAGNTPPIITNKNLKIDFSRPNMDGWTLNVSTPYNEGTNYYTKEISVRIEGNFADDDICPGCIIITPGNYISGDDSFEEQLVATVPVQPDHSYFANLRIKALDGEINEQEYTITLRDGSGFSISKIFKIITDRRPPERVDLQIT